MNAIHSVQSFFARAKSAAMQTAVQYFFQSPFALQQRGSKYLSKSAKRRLVLTTKRARKGFYKGKGSTKEGRLTSKGKFIVDPLKRLQLVVPDLSGFKLKPYIASSVAKVPPEQQRNPLPR